MGEILQCKKDNRQEALDHDEHAAGVYKFESDDAERMFVGHVPIELSMLLSRFLKALEKTAVEVKSMWKTSTRSWFSDSRTLQKLAQNRDPIARF